MPWQWLAALAGVVLACRRPLLQAGGFAPHFGASEYALAVNAINYVDHGFAHRGAIGTLLRLFAAIGLPPYPSLGIVSAILLAWPMALLLGRMRRAAVPAWWWQAILMVALPASFLGWGRDDGRGGMLAAAIIAWAALLWIDRRWIAAALLLSFGTLIHETSLIFGLPLMLAMSLAKTDAHDALVPITRAAFIAVATAAALFVLQSRLGAPPAALARSVLAAAPSSTMTDWAAFITVGGSAGIRYSQCISFATMMPAVSFVAAALIAALIAVATGIRERRALLAYLLATVAPFAAICLVGVDYGRWTLLMTLNAWLAGAALRLRGGAQASPIRWPFAIAALLALLALGSPSIFDPSTVSHRLIGRLRHDPFGPSWNPDACGTGWQTLIPAAR